MVSCVAKINEEFLPADAQAVHNCICADSRAGSSHFWCRGKDYVLKPPTPSTKEQLIQSL